MGFPFKKDKKNKAKNEVSLKGDNSETGSRRKSFLGSPVRLSKKRSSTSAASSTTPSLLQSLNVMAVDNTNVEVMTPDSKKALMEQREAIRKKLFENNAQKQVDDDKEDDDHMHRSATKQIRNTASIPRTATEASKEITPDGKIRDTPLDASQASIPLSQSSVSFTDDTETPLRKIGEESIDFSKSDPTARAALAPISVDVSYTESELASVMTKPASTATPPHNNKKALDPPSQTRRSNSARSAGYPVSLDKSYTSSELGSLMTANRPTTVTESNKTPSPSNKVTVVVSPGSGGSIPMDERSTDNKIVESRNKGKSPLKSPMPDDERAEYQSDEVQALAAVSPLKEIGGDLTIASPPVNNNDDSFLMPESVSNVSITRGVDAKLFHDKGSPQRSVGTKLFDEGSTPPRSEKDSQTMSHASISTGTEGGFTSASGSRTTKNSIPRGTGVPGVAETLLAAAMQCSGMPLNTRVKKNEYYAKETSHRANDESLASSQPGRRPVYFDEATTLRFIRRITNNGFVLLYLQPPGASGNPTDDWNGRTVTMSIKKGQATGGVNGTQQQGKGMQPPKLEWTTVAGGLVTETSTISVNLLDILSISKSVEEMDDEDLSNDEMLFITITTHNGDVHIFEAATLDERDRIVCGLKTLIARLAFYLIAGDASATSELFGSHTYDVEGSEPGVDDDDLPSLPNPSQTMNLVAHTLLEV